MSNKISVFGDELRFCVDSDLERYRVESILEKEPETIAWIDGWENMSKEETSDIFYDVGSNIGIYSLYAAYSYPSLIVYSFEPVSNNYTALQQNVLLNKSFNVHAFRLALANDNRLADLFLSDTRNGNSGAQLDAAINEKGDVYQIMRTEKVLAISMDKLIFDYGMPVPNFVKIDVDGHENEILEGMTQTLSSSSLKSLLVEFNNEEEFAKWSVALNEAGMRVDTQYDSLPNHSRIRRAGNGSLARNYIFSRF